MKTETKQKLKKQIILSFNLLIKIASSLLTIYEFYE